MPARSIRTIAFCLLMVLMMSSTARAQQEWRTTTLEYEPTPLAFGSSNQQQAFDPIDMSPDEWINIIELGPTDQEHHAILATLRCSVIDSHLVVKSPRNIDGEDAFLSRQHTERLTFTEVIIAGETTTVEIVQFGMPYYSNQAFIFIKSENKPWRLIDRVYNFADVEIRHNSRMSWLVGHGDQSATQEGMAFDIWYNPYARRVDAEFVTSGVQIVSLDNVGRTDVGVLARPTFSSYTYTDESGLVIDDTVLWITKYVCLKQNNDDRTGNMIEYRLTQLDEFQQLDVYTFSAETLSLEPTGSRQFENASPVLLEGYTFDLFLTDRVTIPN